MSHPPALTASPGRPPPGRPTGSTRLRPDWRAIAILLLAWALRLHLVENQSLWYDEGTSAALALRTLGQIAANAADDIHPPLYYFLLSLWVRGVGDSVFALRAMSVVLGTFTIAGVFGLSYRLWGQKAACFASLSAAVSPFLVWYSQEARMYVLVGALGVSLIWLTLDRLALLPGADHRQVSQPAPSLRRWSSRDMASLSALLLCTTAALYTHYFAGLSAVLIANGLALLGVGRSWWHTRALPRSWILRWAAIQLSAALVIAPWLVAAWPAISGWPATSQPFGLGFALHSAAAAFFGGSQVPASGSYWWSGWWPVGLLLLVLGAASRGRRGSRWPALYCLLWAALPVVAIWLIGLTRPGWDPKLLIVASVGYELLLGAGISQAGIAGGSIAAGRGPRVSTLAAGAGVGLAAAALLAPRLAGLADMYADPAMHRDDYRGIVRDISTLAGPRDAVILDAPTQIEILGYYDQGRHATYPLPLGWDPEPAETRKRLLDISAEHENIFAVLWATDERDPDEVVERWLNANRYKAFERWYGDVRLGLWAPPSTPPDFSKLDPTATAVFGGEIAFALTHPRLELGAGETLTLDLRWRALAPPRADYTVFVQLLAESDQIVAQRDMRPVGGSARTSEWEPGREVLDRVGLHVPAETSPGDYRLILGLYDSATGRRLPIAQPVGVDKTEHDALAIGTVTIY